MRKSKRQIVLTVVSLSILILSILTGCKKESVEPEVLVEVDQKEYLYGSYVVDSVLILIKNEELQVEMIHYEIAEESGWQEIELRQDFIGFDGIQVNHFEWGFVNDIAFTLTVPGYLPKVVLHENEIGYLELCTPQTNPVGTQFFYLRRIHL